jgi:hypothetical protein
MSHKKGEREGGFEGFWKKQGKIRKGGKERKKNWD